MQVHVMPSPDAGIRKKRRVASATDGELSTDAASASVALSPTSISALSPTTRRVSFFDASRETARRRWRLLQRHVCITQWLSKDLMRRQVKRFALAQESLVDALMTSKDDFTEVFVKIREQFVSLLDAENCFLSFEANRSTLEFDGRGIYPSTRAKRGLLRDALKSGQPVHLFHPSALDAQVMESVPHSIDVRSYVCLPLIDSDGNVQAVAEIFNSRYDPKIVAAWLRADSKGPLHVLRNFVGNLIRAFSKRTNIGELFASTTGKQQLDTDTDVPMTVGSNSHALGDGDGDGDVATGRSSEVSEYPLETLVEFLRHTVGVAQCAVFAYDKDAELLWARFSDSSAFPKTVKPGEGIIGRAAVQGEPLRVSLQSVAEADDSLDPASPLSTMEDSADAPLSNETLFGSSSFPMDTVRDVLCVPTTSAAQKLNGVVLLLNKQDGSAFNEVDVAMSVNLCRHIGHALHSSALHEAILKAQGKAQTLLDLSAVLFRELETTALLAAIMDKIKKPMNASKCCVFLMDDEKHELVAPVGSDLANDAAQTAFRIPATSGVVGAAAQTGEIINVRDAYRDPRFNSSVDQLTGFVTRSILAVPIKDATGEVLGVLEMVNKLSKQYFDKDDEELARGIAYYLAIALKNAKLFESARSAMRRSDALLAMMQVISSSNENVADVFKALVDTACQILNVEHGALFFVDALSKSLFCRVGSNWKGYCIPVGKFIPGIVAESGEIMSLVDAREHPAFDVAYDELVGIQTRSLLCVPIKSAALPTHHQGRVGPPPKGPRENVIAVFYAANKLGSVDGKRRRSPFCEDDVKIMNAICAEISSIIERRSWELVFLVESTASDSSSELKNVTSAFLSQYTTTPTLSRRRSSAAVAVRSRTTTPVLSAPPHATSSASPAPPPASASASASAPAPPRSDVLRRVLKGSTSGSHVCDWDLDPWEHSPPQLVDLALEMFAFFDLPPRFQIAPETLRRFLVGVKAQYQDVPYHNFFHAFATLHVSFLIVSAQPAVDTLVSPTHRALSPVSQQRRLRPVAASPSHLFEARDLLCVFVAAVCHDMNHNGRTNDFHIRYRTSLAMLYNDQSVLENMHAAACFETMRRPGHDLLEHVTPSEYRQMRKSIIRAILATDMHNHAAIVTQLHDKLKVDVFNADDELHKELLLNALVHAADISGPALAEKMHIKWSLQLLQEFNMQYEEEAALGLTPTPYMNAQPGSPELGKLNLAFIDSCVFPLWSILHTFLDGLEPSLDNIQKNRNVWLEMIQHAA
ncbi:hypothetical protein ATCC90586_001916 [Pythium insidiosum]|nr:hypothetical protein ATCC90586_001916 [Pythium insidiosum]